MSKFSTKEKGLQAPNNNTAVDTSVLRDIKSNGKIRPWTPKKYRSMLLMNSLHRLGKPKKANRVYHCGNELGFARSLEGKLTLKTAEFCRERLCPMCAWRKSLKMFHTVSKIMDVTEARHPDLVPVFLTLTVRNCKEATICTELDNMFKAWSVFVHHRSFTDVVHGWYRALEITHDNETHISAARYASNPSYYTSLGIKAGSPNPNYATFHPHFHIILLVHKDYFKKDNKKYIPITKWVHMWRVSLGVDYSPVCDIRKVNKNKGKHKAVAEVAKYTVKDCEYLTKNNATTDRLVELYSKALFHRRLYAFGGILKKIAKELNAEQPDAGDLINIDEDKIREDIATILEIYRWDMGITNYVKYRVEEYYVT